MTQEEIIEALKREVTDKTFYGLALKRTLETGRTAPEQIIGDIKAISKNEPARERLLQDIPEYLIKEIETNF